MKYFTEIQIDEVNDNILDAPLRMLRVSLLQDPCDKSMLGKVEFFNQCRLNIIAVFVKLSAFNIASEEVLLDKKEYIYQDMIIEPGELYGSKIAIHLPDDVRKLFAVIEKVVFEDGSVWKRNEKDIIGSNKAKMISVPEKYAERIREELQKHISNLEYANYYYEDEQRFWRCSCGKIHSLDIDCCDFCGNARVTQHNYLTEDSIEKICNVIEEADRIEEEKKKKIKEERDRISREEARKRAEEAIKKAEEAKILEQKYLIEQERARKQKAKRKRKIILTLGGVVVLFSACMIIFETRIIPYYNYNAALKLIEEENYESAINVFSKLGDYKDSKEKIQLCEVGNEDMKYKTALKLMEEGSFKRAMKMFEELEDYKDSKSQVCACEVDIIRNAAKNDIVLYGKYEQDNVLNNGAENIEWIVLEKEEDKALLLSKYALDCQPFNDSYKDITWKHCSLRTWLNNEFLNESFSEDELKMIRTTEIIKSENPKYNISAINERQDQIFLLSILDAEEYFGSNEERKCEATVFAKENGVQTSPENRKCTWWLIAPGSNIKRAAKINRDGSIGYSGEIVTFPRNAVRPAMWISLNS